MGSFDFVLDSVARSLAPFMVIGGLGPPSSVVLPVGQSVALVVYMGDKLEVSYWYTSTYRYFVWVFYGFGRGRKSVGEALEGTANFCC